MLNAGQTLDFVFTLCCNAGFCTENEYFI